MRLLYYGKPSCTLVRTLFAARAKAQWLRFPAAAVMVIAWSVLMPLAWLAIKAGEAGHALAGWCGFDSRNW